MKLIIIKPRCREPDKMKRLEMVLSYGIENAVKEEEITAEYIETASEIKDFLEKEQLKNKRILFAISLGVSGVNLEYYEMLKAIRLTKNCFCKSVAEIIIDGKNEFYTKSIARELVMAANIAGCTFVGSPLVEGTGSLKNFEVKASNLKKNTTEAYMEFARTLINKVIKYYPIKKKYPKLLCVHASDKGRSNTLHLWNMVKKNIGKKCEIQEVSLAKENIQDCAGCSYTVCMYYGKKNRCLYNDIIVEKIYPLLQESDALIMLCPNYNDAIGAGLTAFVNRLTALYRICPFDNKYLYAIVVSGYSGGDLVSEQLIGGLNMNKSFILPEKFVLTATANAPGSVLEIPEIEQKAEKFAKNIQDMLLKE